MMPRPRKVLITGCSGFCGFFLSEHFSRKGIAVVGLDTAPHPARGDLPGFTFHACDIRDRRALRDIFAAHEPTHVIHMIPADALTGDAIFDRGGFVDTCWTFAPNFTNLLTGIPAAGTFTVTPEKPGYAFDPTNRVIDVFGANGEGVDLEAGFELPVDPVVDTNSCSVERYEIARVNEGDEHHVDRDCTVTDIPDAFSGLYWLKTAMEDKTCTQDPLAVLTALRR